MGRSLDDLLRSLPAPALDHPLDQLEPHVWRRIEARRRSEAPGALRMQLMAAGMALALGVVLGWSMSSHSRAADGQSLLYDSYAELGPIARLEGGL